MHVPVGALRSLDENCDAVDLGQTPAEIIVLSFSDSDLALLERAHEALGADAPSLRLANLASLRHPFSVDLYLDKVIRHARFVLVRCLGGMDYWRYGIEQLMHVARRTGIMLALLPGDQREDFRLHEASTLPREDLLRLHGWFEAGGIANMRAALGSIATRLGRPFPAPDPLPLPAFGCAATLCGCTSCALTDCAASPEQPRAVLLFYRSLYAAGDSAPVASLIQALKKRNFSVLPLFVTSLKDRNAADPLKAALVRFRPDVIINTTGFSARMGEEGAVLDSANAPVLQALIANTFRADWEARSRGLAPSDLAMNVVLPEVDGRLTGPPISFKEERERTPAREFTRVVHVPHEAGIARTADWAEAYARLRRLPREARKLALVLSDYPMKGGRTGYAVGLDGPASLIAIADDLRANGFDIGMLPDAAELIRMLETEAVSAALPLAVYRHHFAGLPDAYQKAVLESWGDPSEDALVREGSFHFKALLSGQLIIAVQPDRGRRTERALDHHDLAHAPCHGYGAFYLWLRLVQKIHALIHLGTHGTLEWLPGKAIGLSEACAPAVLTGALPIFYPFIVNNPGEAAQAKRRLGAVTIGHRTPPLIAAGTHGASAEIEALLDEFAAAQALDPARAKRLAGTILEKAHESGLAEDCGLKSDLDLAQALSQLDAFICEIKEMRISDGLVIFGRPAPIAEESPTFAALLHASAAAESGALLDALDGRFIPPGPAGTPLPDRQDVLPTGRNLTSADPRAVPTRTAYESGAKIAEDVLALYTEQHGDYPRRLVIDLWGSASLRSGGVDLAQAFALIGTRPSWDTASFRVSGFEILSPALLGRPRVDVVLRISGLFRDLFPEQIALFHAASRAVAALDEDEWTNPLAAEAHQGLPRIFGAGLEDYGMGRIAAHVAADQWGDREDLGALYCAASRHAYDGKGNAEPAPQAFAALIARADGVLRGNDVPGRDVLNADAFADALGGFAAAAGDKAELYYIDTANPVAKVRSLRQEIARAIRGRASNPRWLAGQMRHGHRGAAEIAETVNNLLAFAASARAVTARQFDIVFAATLGDETVRDFLLTANPRAARAIAASFDQALRRGLWANRRNSVAPLIAEILERAP